MMPVHLQMENSLRRNCEFGNAQHRLPQSTFFQVLQALLMLFAWNQSWEMIKLHSRADRLWLASWRSCLILPSQQPSSAEKHNAHHSCALDPAEAWSAIFRYSQLLYSCSELYRRCARAQDEFRAACTAYYIPNLNVYLHVKSHFMFI